MVITDKIRTQHIEKKLQELVAKPHRKSIMHLDQLKNICLIVQNPTDKDKTTISQFNKMLAKRSINLRTIEQPQNTGEHTDKYGLPKDSYIEPYTRYHYNLTIDATPHNSLFGAYVTLSTSSNLRVGYSMIRPTQEGDEKSINESYLSNTVKNPRVNIQHAGADTGVSPYNLNDIYDLTIIGNTPLDLSTYLTEILKYLVQIRK